MFKKVKKAHNKRPGWGDVYDYGNMHNELLDGTFESETCDIYYDFVDAIEAEQDAEVEY